MLIDVSKARHVEAEQRRGGLWMRLMAVGLVVLAMLSACLMFSLIGEVPRLVPRESVHCPSLVVGSEAWVECVGRVREL